MHEGEEPVVPPLRACVILAATARRVPAVRPREADVAGRVRVRFLPVDDDGVAVDDLAGEDALRQPVADLALDEPAQRTGAVRRVESGERKPFAGRGADVQLEPAVVQPLTERLDLQLHDPGELVEAQRIEDHHVVEPVEELRPEVRVHGGHHGGALRGVVERGVHEELRPEVRRQHEDDVAEVHGAALAVREAPVVQHLQEQVEHFRVRLLHLVEQHHAVGAAPHGLGELAALS